MPTTTNYIWDEDNLLAEADGSNTIQTVYTNEPERYGNLISSRISGTTSYHHFDAMGSTRQLTNSADSVTDTTIYDAWGNVVNRSGTTLVFLLWIGELGYYFDSETELFWIARRPYSPIISRWTTVDPFLIAASIIVYVYSVNSPIGTSDPSGLSPKLAGPATDQCCECNMTAATFKDDGKLRITIARGKNQDPTICEVEVECTERPSGPQSSGCLKTVGQCGYTFNREAAQKNLSTGKLESRIKVCVSCLCRPSWVVLTHELVHAAQSCRFGAPKGIGLTCEQSETEAATAHCEAVAKEKERRKEPFDFGRCVDCSVAFSCPDEISKPMPACKLSEFGLDVNPGFKPLANG